MIKHTPGPYKFNGPHDIKGGGRGFVVEADTPLGTATLAIVTANGADLPQARIDVRLFAAAPDMLEALKRARTLIDDDTCRHDYEKAAALVAINAAIAKAEGGE